MRRFANVLVLGVMTLSLSGCWSFFGGGWFWSNIDPTQRVNVGLEGTCTDDLGTGFGLVDLELTFHDRGFPAEGVYDQNKNGKKHMAVSARNPQPLALTDSCENFDASILGDFAVGAQQFVYCPQGVSEGDACGVGFVEVRDTTDGGPDKGDVLFLTLSGGFYDGYFFGGELQGGNFTVENVIN